jgi:predicted amidohydrolase YtcJ
MGDRAVGAGLDAIEQAIAENGTKDPRHQLAHVALATPRDSARFGDVGVIANFSPGWFRPDDPALAGTKAAIGAERAKNLFPIARIASLGGRIVMSSDWPATSMNPLEGIEVAITRQAPGGVGPVNNPKNRVSLALALRAYTLNAAWAVREDAVDGSLEAGKAADLIVLEGNLFRIPKRSIHKARVLLTLLDGEPVYRAITLAWN